MCCCCYKRTAHLVVVWLTLICTIASLIFAIIEAVDARGNYLDEMIAGIVVSIIQIGICILDIFGIKKSNWSYMIPFFISMVIAAVGLSIGLGLYIVMMEQDNYYPNALDEYITIIVLYILLFLLVFYFCFVIAFHMHEVRRWRRALEAGSYNTRRWRKAGREAWIPYNDPAVSPRVYNAGLPMEGPIAGQHLRQDLPEDVGQDLGQDIRWTPHPTDFHYPTLPRAGEIRRIW